jgi:hypothetical protein
MGATCSRNDDTSGANHGATPRQLSGPSSPPPPPPHRNETEPTRCTMSRKLSFQSGRENPLLPVPQPSPELVAPGSPCSIKAPPVTATTSQALSRPGSPSSPQRPRRRVVPPKLSPRVAPSAFHSVVPARFEAHQELEPMVEISALRLLGSHQFLQLAILPQPAVVLEKVDEEDSPPLSPFLLRRIEVERQNNLNCTLNASRSQSEGPPGVELDDAFS